MGAAEGLHSNYDVEKENMHEPEGDTGHAGTFAGMEDAPDDLHLLPTATGHEWYSNNFSGDPADTSSIGNSVDALGWETSHDPSMASGQLFEGLQAPADLQPLPSPKPMNRGTKRLAVWGILALLIAVALLKVAFLALRRPGAGSEDNIRDEEPLDEKQEQQREDKKANAVDSAGRENQSGVPSVDGDQEDVGEAPSLEQVEAEKERALDDLEAFLSGSGLE